jgi:toxin ParE1/3/4
MRKYKIFRHPNVELDLLDIVDLIAEYAGSTIAAQKLDQIEASVQKLAQTPHVGSLRHEIYPDLRAIPTARKGVIAFVVDDEAQVVFIVSITYAGADWITRSQNRT